MEDIFYFLCHPSGDKSKIMVVDEYKSLHYEKEEYSLVNGMEWNNSKDAIDYGIELAVKYNLIYVNFNSRCGSGLDVGSGLYL